MILLLLCCLFIFFLGKRNFPVDARAKVANSWISSFHKLALSFNAAQCLSYQTPCSPRSLTDRKLAQDLIITQLFTYFYIPWIYLGMPTDLKTTFSSHFVFSTAATSPKSRQFASVPSSVRLPQELDHSVKHGASSSSCLSVLLLWNTAEILLSPCLEGTRLSTRHADSCMLLMWC